MLAQNFKTATDLGITDAELDALIRDARPSPDKET